MITPLLPDGLLCFPDVAVVIAVVFIYFFRNKRKNLDRFIRILTGSYHHLHSTFSDYLLSFFVVIIVVFFCMYWFCFHFLILVASDDRWSLYRGYLYGMFQVTAYCRQIYCSMLVCRLFYFGVYLKVKESRSKRLRLLSQY